MQPSEPSVTYQHVKRPPEVARFLRQFSTDDRHAVTNKLLAMGLRSYEHWGPETRAHLDELLAAATRREHEKHGLADPNPHAYPYKDLHAYANMQKHTVSDGIRAERSQGESSIPPYHGGNRAPQRSPLPQSSRPQAPNQYQGMVPSPRTLSEEAEGTTNTTRKPATTSAATRASPRRTASSSTGKAVKTQPHSNTQRATANARPATSARQSSPAAKRTPSAAKGPNPMATTNVRHTSTAIPRRPLSTAAPKAKAVPARATPSPPRPQKREPSAVYTPIVLGPSPKVQPRTKGTGPSFAAAYKSRPKSPSSGSGRTTELSSSVFLVDHAEHPTNDLEPITHADAFNVRDDIKHRRHEARATFGRFDGPDFIFVGHDFEQMRRKRQKQLMEARPSCNESEEEGGEAAVDDQQCQRSASTSTDADEDTLRSPSVSGNNTDDVDDDAIVKEENDDDDTGYDDIPVNDNIPPPPAADDTPAEEHNVGGHSPSSPTQSNVYGLVHDECYDAEPPADDDETVQPTDPPPVRALEDCFVGEGYFSPDAHVVVPTPPAVGSPRRSEARRGDRSPPKSVSRHEGSYHQSPACVPNHSPTREDEAFLSATDRVGTPSPDEDLVAPPMGAEEARSCAHPNAVEAEVEALLLVSPTEAFGTMTDPIRPPTPPVLCNTSVQAEEEPIPPTPPVEVLDQQTLTDHEAYDREQERQWAQRTATEVEAAVMSALSAHSMAMEHEEEARRRNMRYTASQTDDVRYYSRGEQTDDVRTVSAGMQTDPPRPPTPEPEPIVVEEPTHEASVEAEVTGDPYDGIEHTHTTGASSPRSPIGMAHSHPSGPITIVKKATQHRFVADFDDADSCDGEHETSIAGSVGVADVHHYTVTTEVRAPAGGPREEEGPIPTFPPTSDWHSMGSGLAGAASLLARDAEGNGSTIRTFKPQFVHELKQLVVATRGVKLSAAEVAKHLPTELEECIHNSGFANLYRTLLVMYHLNA